MTDLPKTMRGIWLIGHGDMDMLDIRQDIPVPIPGTRDVLVRVAAAGINNTQRTKVMVDTSFMDAEEQQPTANRRPRGVRRFLKKFVR